MQPAAGQIIEARAKDVSFSLEGSSLKPNNKTCLRNLSGIAHAATDVIQACDDSRCRGVEKGKTSVSTIMLCRNAIVIRSNATKSDISHHAWRASEVQGKGSKAATGLQPCT